MSLLSRCKRLFRRPHIRLIALFGVIVPRRLRAGWRQEWEAELRHREALLAEWDRLDRRNKLDLVWRSTSAFWDALWLQPKRLEDEMFQDLRFGVRMLLKNPVFTLKAVFTLALGIGANTAIFSVINAVLLRPLPYGEAERLVMVGHSWSDGLPGEISSLNYLDCRDQNSVFDHTTLVQPWAVNLTGQDRPELLLGLHVSAGFFTTLKVQPLLGRVFLPEEDKPGSDRVVVLSHGLWQRRFGGDQQILGKSVTLDDKSYSVVGVMPPSFRYFRAENVEIIAPGAPSPEMSRQYQRQWETFYMIARLKPGLRDITAQRRFMVLLLSIFAGTALALAAIGLSGVIAYSVSQRTHEIGIRMALGARASDVLRLIIGRGLKLILIGVALGLAGAYALTRLLKDFLFDVKPTDPTTFAVIPLLLVAVALLASYLPARRATKVDPMITLRHE